MREIKFRVWDKANGLMFPPKGIGHKWGIAKGCRKNVVFLQFTGLKDKNGKDIYEGDILQEDKNIVVVEWDEKITGFNPFCHHFFIPCNEHRREEDECDCEKILVYEEGNQFNIIGNIYENPELLKSK